MHPTCTPCVPYMPPWRIPSQPMPHITCTLCAPYMHPMYTFMFTLHAPYMHPTCTLHVPYVHLLCTLCAPYVHPMCTLHDTLHAPDMHSWRILIGQGFPPQPMTLLIEQPYLHKILIFCPHHLLKSLHEARIDQLADSNEPATIVFSYSVTS